MKNKEKTLYRLQHGTLSDTQKQTFLSMLETANRLGDLISRSSTGIAKQIREAESTLSAVEAMAPGAGAPIKALIDNLKKQAESTGTTVAFEPLEEIEKIEQSFGKEIAAEAIYRGLSDIISADGVYYGFTKPAKQGKLSADVLAEYEKLCESLKAKGEDEDDTETAVS